MIATIFIIFICVVFVAVLYRKMDLFNKFHAFMLSRIAKRYNWKVKREKAELFGSIKSVDDCSGDSTILLLEVGCGSGANFAFYPDGCNVTGLDPNTHFKKYLESSSSLFPNIRFTKLHVGYGEDMRDFESNSFDAVVTTLVMCSVKSQPQCLSEIRRVLKPGGKYYFIEHVACAEKDSWLYYFQKMVSSNPLWKWGSGGCSLVRDTAAEVKSTFDKTDIQYVRVTFRGFMALISPHIFGTATK